MCNQHLLGEHLETHMFLGCVQKHKSLKGYIERSIFFPQELKLRHDEIAKEMTLRGMKHKTPMQESLSGYVSVVSGLQELIRRCPECRKKYEEGIDISH